MKSRGSTLRLPGSWDAVGWSSSPSSEGKDMQRKEYVVKVEPAGELKMRQIISTGTVDRAGDRIPVSSWNLGPFKANSVICWAHRYDIPAIATATNIEVVGETLVSTARFPPAGVHALSDTVYGLLENGILKAASVGFNPGPRVPNEFGGFDFGYPTELYEWSYVNIGMNSEALA